MVLSLALDRAQPDELLVIEFCVQHHDVLGLQAS